jgi:hypothetical protein
MKKFLIVAGVVAILLVGIRWATVTYMKRNSPEIKAAFTEGDLQIEVFYNSPAKKGREIFGNLVPFDSVWRTGANEATTFETNKDLLIQGKILKAGKYSLWTIPGVSEWKILFNSKWGQWGIGFNGLANRDVKDDVLVAQVLSVNQDKVIEDFTISVEKMDEEIQLILMWDKTIVSLPMAVISR